MGILSKTGRGLLRASMVGLRRSPYHITRYYMYEHLAKRAEPLRKPGRVLAISHSLDFAQILGLDVSNAVEANYPDVTMTDLPYPDESFDFVVSDQVLEHVNMNPQIAIDESRRVLKPGGIAVHTTCLMNPIHNYPGDFWRFTPDALKLLCADFSEIIEATGFGNFPMWIIVALGMRRDKIPLATWHPLHRIATKNNPNWPCATWVVARK